ncbi:nuclear envelope pore membrane protein POM 121-like isoform X2 [Pleurodeles waltl]|uniref:nuclear envelope pore membrane protein POM 121-like isoform X2 n=1 Tax=Pleurodeles waltl TaxID=8319 RepID=UPI003709651E
MVPAAGRHSATLVLVRHRARGAAWAALLLLGAGLLLPTWAVLPLLLLAGGAWCLHSGPPGLFLLPEPPPKPCANGGPSPSPRAMLMGSYLGHPEGGAEGARGQQHRLREALHRPNPAVPSPQRRLSYGEPSSMNRFALTPRRRYPIQQTQYAMTGAMPTVRWDGYQRKNVLTAKNSTVVHSPVTVKIAPPDSKIARSPIFNHLTSPVLKSVTNVSPDPCARETVLNALKASRKRVVEEDITHLDGQENKRRRHDSSGSGQSAFESLVANGSLASLVPKPGILKRTLNSQSTDDNHSKRSRTSSVGSANNTGTAGIQSSVRNAITSSYSSSRGLVKTSRSGPSTSPLSSPSSSRSQTPERPAKKTREDALQQSNASTPKSDGKELQTGKDLPILVEKPNSMNVFTSPSSDGKRKRKMQLLALRRRDPLIMPPPPQLGYSVTAEDLDAEKKAALQYINKALEEEPSAPSSSSTTETMTSRLSLAFTVETSATTASSVGANKSLEISKEMQKPAATTEPAIAAVPAAASAPIFSVVSSAFPKTQSESKPVATWSVSSNFGELSSGAQSSATSQTTVSVAMPAVSSPSRSTELSKPSPLMRLLLEKPSEESVSAPQPTGITETPTFKPVFGTQPKVDSTTSSASTCTVAPSTATFKPIFGNLTNPAPVSASSSAPFSFGQSIGTAVTSAQTAVPTASSSIFTELAKSASSTTASSTAGSFAEPGPKPSFAFGLQAAANVPSSTVATTAVQPFQFTVAASNTTTTTAAGAFGTNSIFQFSKPTSSTGTVSATSAQPVVTTFGQAPSVTAPVASGFIFGGGPATVSTTANTSQPTTFGSSASFFSSGSSSFTMNPNPSYTTGQTAHPSTTKPANMTFGSTPSPFNFGSSTQQPAQPAFAGTNQPAFGANSQTSFGTAGNTQLSFGAAKPVLSLGQSTSIPAPGFGSGMPQTTSGSVFGSAAQPQFGFPTSSQPGNTSSAFGLGTHSTSTAPSVSGFNFGSGQNAAPTNTSVFGSAPMASSVMSTPNHNATFAFGSTNTSENRLTFGGSSTPTFGQSSTAASSNQSFATPGTPAMGFSTPGPSFGLKNQPVLHFLKL